MNLCSADPTYLAKGFTVIPRPVSLIELRIPRSDQIRSRSYFYQIESHGLANSTIIGSLQLTLLSICKLGIVSQIQKGKTRHGTTRAFQSTTWSKYQVLCSAGDDTTHKEKVFSLTGDDFTIKTTAGVEICKCKGKVLSISDKKRKLMSMPTRSSWS